MKRDVQGGKRSPGPFAFALHPRWGGVSPMNATATGIGRSPGRLTETISVPRACVETEDGKLREWRSKALPR